MGFYLIAGIIALSAGIAVEYRLSKFLLSVTGLCFIIVDVLEFIQKAIEGIQ